MDFAVDATIVAVASPPGGAVRGIIRISGPDTVACLAQCFRAECARNLADVRVPTRVFGHLQLPAPIGLLPCHVYLWPTRRSYTRQPSAELHTLGSPPLLEAAVECLCSHGARLARPGEFTWRAFLAGRLDLTQAEAVLGVIDAENSRELAVALRQLAGGLSHPLLDMRNALLDLLAQIEAGLDFVDEDIAFITPESTDQVISTVLASVAGMLDQLAARGESSAEPRVVLRGCANVGKSSLLNALVDVDAALVSPHAGTTRDYVSRPFQWQGVSGLLVDTAGVTAAPADALAPAAHEAAEEQARHAHLVVLCLDASRPLQAWERAALEDRLAAPPLIVWTKVDLAAARPAAVPGAMATSARTGEGLEALRAAIAARLSDRRAGASTVVASTAVRCRQSLAAARAHLLAARQLLVERRGDELLAVELRDALDQLGAVVGAVYTDDILTRIFSRFCIGK